MTKHLLTAVALTTCATAHAQQFSYPSAPQDGTTDTYFGETVADPFRPLEDDNAAATAAWVEAENEVTEAYLAKIPFRKKLLRRLKEVANYGKVSAPSYNKHTGMWIFWKNDGLQNQSVVYQTDDLGDERNARVFLDPNALSDDGTIALKDMSFDNTGKYCAYSISRSGSDWQEFYVVDARTGEPLDDHIEWAKFSGASWLGDGFFYSAYDKPDEEHAYSETNSVHKVYYHKVGTPQSEDRLFYQNPAYPMRFYEVWTDEDETVQILYESGASVGNDLYLRDLREPSSQFIQMTANMDFLHSPIGVVGDKLYLLTNDGAPRYRIMVASIGKPGFNDWQTVIPESENVLESAALIDGKLVVTYMKDAADQAAVYSLEGEKICDVELPGVGTVAFYGDKDRKECFYSYTSFTQPGTVYRYDMDSNTSTVYSQPKVNFNLKDYVTEQVFYTSKDGTRVPMSLTYKRGLKLNGKNPVYLYGYGGFNIPLPPSFSSSRIPFLEAGGIYAQANLRGGSEYGEDWHLSGTKTLKQNVFDDFISAAEWLIAQGYTSSDYLAIVGGSNGGLLVGACMTQRPDLFKVAIPQVGVMDMLRYHKFTIGWCWADEFGTSEDSPEMFQYLRGYSPLHNIREGVSYPATLVTTADHDDRVVPAHSFKFAATLQKCNANDKPMLIRIDTKAGHGGGKPLSKQLEEQADIYSFILHNMGLKY